MPFSTAMSLSPLLLAVVRLSLILRTCSSLQVDIIFCVLIVLGADASVSPSCFALSASLYVSLAPSCLGACFLSLCVAPCAGVCGYTTRSDRTILSIGPGGFVPRVISFSPLAPNGISLKRWHRNCTETAKHDAARADVARVGTRHALTRLGLGHADVARVGTIMVNALHVLEWMVRVCSQEQQKESQR